MYIWKLKYRRRETEKRKLPNCGLVELDDGGDQILGDTSSTVHVASSPESKTACKNAGPEKIHIVRESQE